MSSDRYRGIIPFFIAGDGAHLRFRTKDLVALREKYGERFELKLETLIIQNDPVAIVDALKAGLKTEDGRKPFPGVDYDDLPFGLQEAQQPLIDALVLAITGQSYAALLDVRKRVAEEAADADPPWSLGTTSPTSSSASFGPDTEAA